MNQLLQHLKENKLLTTKIEKFTFLINEQHVSEGVLIFVPFKSKQVKIVIPAPFHQALFEEDNTPSYQDILSHKEAIFLK